MSRRKPPTKFRRAVQKYGVSAFVIGSFAAYAIHERAASPSSEQTALLAAQSVALAQPALLSTATALTSPAPTRAAIAQLPTRELPTPTAPDAVIATIAPPVPTATDEPATVAGQLRDGTYTGPVVDAYYGNVQVAARIEGGRIIDVQFLDYPHDRRTSNRINRYAMPYLMREAIQAQSAHVDIISGATLTSEAFEMSLQSALDAARA